MLRNLLDTYEAPSEIHRHCAPSVRLWPAAAKQYAQRTASSLTIVIDCSGTTGCGKLWMKTEWNARKNILQFSYLFSCRLWKTWFERGLENFATALRRRLSRRHCTLASQLQTRLVDWSISRTAEQLWSVCHRKRVCERERGREREQLQCWRYHFVIDHSSIFLFSVGK